MACGLICAGGRNSVGCEGYSAASDSSQGRQRDVCVIRWANRMGTHARVLGSHINSKCQHTARASRHASAAPHSLTSEISSRVLHRRSTSTSLLLGGTFLRKPNWNYPYREFLVASTGTGTAITTGVFDKFGSVLVSGRGARVGTTVLR